MVQNIWAIVCMLLFFGGSIFVHELGHFLAAKKRKLKVPLFSIGFGPKIFSWTRGETEYRISLLPFGGYVALPQMGETPVLEEKSDTNTTTDSGITFSDTFIVAVMGAVFNVLFAFCLAFILWVVGLPSSESEQTTRIGYVLPTFENGESKIEGPAFKAGLQAGDQILSVDEKSAKTFSDINSAIVLGTGRTPDGTPKAEIKIQRGNEIQSFTVYPQKVTFNATSKDKMRAIGILPAQSMTVGSIFPNSPAEKAGLKIGDRLLNICSPFQTETDNFFPIPLYSLAALQAYLDATEGRPLTLEVERDGKVLPIEFSPIKLAYQRPWMKVFLNNHTEQFLELYPEYTPGSKEVVSATTPSTLKILDRNGTAFEAFEKDKECLTINGQRIQSLEEAKNELARPGDIHMWELKDTKSGKQSFIALPSKGIEVALQDPLYLYLLGVQIAYKEILTHPTPLAQFRKSFSTTVETLSKLVNRNSDVKIKNLMGPPGIMRLLHQFSSNDFRRLLWFTILLNINLAVLNLLPIPILDGGRIVLAFIERIRRKPISPQWLNWIQTVFVFLFLGLMVYVSFFDIRRWQGDRKTASAIEKQIKLNLPVSF